jgi:hypothetical protein
VVSQRADGIFRPPSHSRQVQSTPERRARANSSQHSTGPVNYCAACAHTHSFIHSVRVLQGAGAGYRCRIASSSVRAGRSSSQLLRNYCHTHDYVTGQHSVRRHFQTPSSSHTGPVNSCAPRANSSQHPGPRVVRTHSFIPYTTSTGRRSWVSVAYSSSRRVARSSQLLRNY